MENDGPLPDELFEAYLCEQYHCLPSQLDREDAIRLRRNMGLLSAWRAAGKPHKQWTAGDAAIMWPLLDADWKRKHG